MVKRWIWRELALDDLLAASFEAATDAWRGPDAVALVVPLNTTTCGIVRLVHLLPPLGQVHWATLYTALLPPRVISVERQEAVSKGLTVALRRSAVPASQRRLQWLRLLYAEARRPLPMKVQSLSSPAFPYKERGRVESAVLFEDEYAPFIEDQDALLAEAGPLAFFGVDERIGMQNSEEPGSLRGSLLRGFSPIAFNSRRDAWFELSRRLLKLLHREVQDLEDGRSFSLHMEPGQLVHPHVDLHLPPAGWWQWEDETLLRELLSCRARLVRLLGWPMHLPSVLRAFQGVDGIIAPLEDLGVMEPFDALAELKHYLPDMAARYPRHYARAKRMTDVA